MRGMEPTIENAECSISSVDAPKDSTINLSRGDSIIVTEGMELTKGTIIPLPKNREITISEDCTVVSLEFLESGAIVITDLEGVKHEFDSAIDFQYPSLPGVFELEEGDLLWNLEKGDFESRTEEDPVVLPAMQVTEPDDFAPAAFPILGSTLEGE